MIFSAYSERSEITEIWTCRNVCNTCTPPKAINDETLFNVLNTLTKPIKVYPRTTIKLTARNTSQSKFVRRLNRNWTLIASYIAVYMKLFYVCTVPHYQSRRYLCIWRASISATHRNSHFVSVHGFGGYISPSLYTFAISFSRGIATIWLNVAFFLFVCCVFAPQLYEALIALRLSVT